MTNPNSPYDLLLDPSLVSNGVNGLIVPYLRTELGFSIDARYAGQSHELRVGDLAAFHDEHARYNGYARPDAPVEVVAIRARAWRDAPLAPEQLPAPERAAVTGPAVVAEPDCTIWVPDGWTAQPGPLGAFLLSRAGHA